MNRFKTPDKIQCRLQPGHVAVHSKWKNTVILDGLNAFFNRVQLTDLGSLDVCLPDISVIYLPESRLSQTLDEDTLSSYHASLVIADRNTSTVEAFAEAQKVMCKLGMTLLPVGHIGEVASLLHQFYVASTTSSPGSTYDATAKAEPGIQVTLLLNIPGLGRTKASKLLRTFGTIQRVGVASLEDLTSCVGKATASEIVKYFQLHETS